MIKHLYLLLLIPLALRAQTHLRTIDVTSASVLESENLGPIPVNIVTNEEFQERGATRLQEALYLQEGVSLVRSGSKLAPSIRGFNPEHTLILIDGQRLTNEPGNKYDLERMDLTDIERIEVIKGPLSTIYGADALGGVINLVSRKIEKDQVKLHLRNANYDFKSPRNAASLQIDKKISRFGVRLFGTQTKEAPLLFNHRESIDDKKEISTFGGVLEFTQGSLTFRGRQSWSQDTHESLYFNFLNENYVRDDDRHLRTFSSGELVYKQDKLTHTTTATYTSYQKRGDTHLQSNDQLLMSKRARIYVTELNHRSELVLDNQLLTLGLNHRREDFYGNAFNYDNHSKYLPEYSSVYLIDQWAATNRLIIVPSLRFEHINYFEDKLLTQAGATLFLDDRSEQSLKFNFAQGRRVPTPKDLYVDVMIMKGNPNLIPETSQTYNLEYHFLSRQTSFRLGYFYNDVDGLIQEHYDPSLSKFTFRNLPSATIQGVEASGRHRFRYHENTLAYTYLEANEEVGGRLPNRARHHPILNTTYYIGEYKLINDISCQLDELLYDENNRIKKFSYCSFDLGLIRQFYKYHILVRGTNLFNEFERGIPQRPRLFTLALNAQF